MRADKKNIDNWHSVYLTPLVLHHTLNRKKTKKQKTRKLGAHSGQSNTHKKTKSKGKDKKENGKYEFVSNVANIWFPFIFCLPIKQNSVLL